MKETSETVALIAMYIGSVVAFFTCLYFIRDIYQNWESAPFKDTENDIAYKSHSRDYSNLQQQDMPLSEKRLKDNKEEQLSEEYKKALQTDIEKDMQYISMLNKLKKTSRFSQSYNEHQFMKLMLEGEIRRQSNSVRRFFLRTKYSITFLVINHATKYLKEAVLKQK